MNAYVNCTHCNMRFRRRGMNNKCCSEACRVLRMGSLTPSRRETLTRTNRNSAVRDLSRQGYTYAEIGTLFGIIPQRVHQLVTGAYDPSIQEEVLEEFAAFAPSARAHLESRLMGTA